MAFCFGDGFDSYAAVSDAGLGYWDAVSTGVGNIVLFAGRFAGSQAFSFVGSVNSNLTKISGVNDAVHHITVAFRQSAVLSGTNLGLYFQFIDNVTNQCCIVFRQDGAILLTSATPGGTVLATYIGAVTASNTWVAFEFEVVISNTVGRFRVRKNGNTVDDFDSGATLNTRPGTNAYANKLFIAMSTSVTAQQIDDILWRSDASSVPFVGDVRCYTRMPASDVSATFTKSLTSTVMSQGQNNTATDATATARYVQFTPTYSGTVTTVGVLVNTAFTGNMKCAIFADSANSPGTVIQSAVAVLVNGVIGTNLFTFTPPVALVKGTSYWIGVSHDVTVSLGAHAVTSLAKTGTGVPYASFPAASPVVGAFTNSLGYNFTITLTTNADMVNETLQDGTTSYVYSSNPTDADFYTVSPLAGTPAAVIAVVTRGFLQKSDAGTRGAAVQLKSGGTVVGSTPTLLGTNFGWLYRTDTVDPATGLPWTSAAVNNIQCGPVVTS